MKKLAKKPVIIALLIAIGLFGTTAASAKMYDIHPSEEVRANSVSILESAGIDANSLTITVSAEGAVNIEGYVDSKSQVDKVTELVDSVPGVYGVFTKLRYPA